MSKDPYMLQTLSNGIDVIYLFEKEDRPLSIQEISEKINLNRTTLFRLLYTLRHKGILEIDGETGKYRLGLKIVQLSSLVLQRIGIKDTVRPFLEKLRDKLNETVHLLILGDHSVIFIDKVEVRETMLMNSYIGKVAPLYCTASGKLFLSYQTEAYIENYLETVTLKKLTHNTITDKKELRKHLKDIRERGYSITDEESEEGLYGFAAPILNSKGSMIASVSVSGPLSRLNRKKDVIFKEVMSTAEMISKDEYIRNDVSSNWL